MTIPLTMSSIDSVVTLDSGITAAKVNLRNGQLFSLAQNGVEYMHPGGKPNATGDDRKGWGNSELAMFPVVGKAKEYEAAGQVFPMAQHGLVRHQLWLFCDATSESVFLEQIYQGELVRNTKYSPDNGEHPDLQGVPYLFQKFYHVHDGFTAQFSIRNVGENPLPYDWGWHPAFAASEDAVVRVDGKVIPLRELQQMPGSVSKHKSDRAVLEGDLRNLELQADAGYMQIWSPPGSSLVCVEPITKHPDANRPTQVLHPGESKLYIVDIKIA